MASIEHEMHHDLHWAEIGGSKSASAFLLEPIDQDPKNQFPVAKKIGTRFYSFAIEMMFETLSIPGFICVK